MKNSLDYLMVHCTYTPAMRAVTKEDLKKWHIEERGWSRVGYSDMIHLDGSLENLIPYNQDDIIDTKEVSNGASGYNRIARHVVYVGGKGGDTRTDMQFTALAIYCRFTVLRHPKIKIIGHNQVSNKSCPSFDVPQFCKDIGLSSINIGL